jgi:hypothetical protein
MLLSTTTTKMKRFFVLNGLTVKDGWQDLVNNWENLKEVEIDFIENERDFKVYRKVVSLWTSQGEIII